MAIINLGRVGYVHKGAYDPTITYEKYDVVLYNHGSYLYIGESASSGKEPTDTSYWQAMLDPEEMNDAVEAAVGVITELATRIDSLTTPFEERGAAVACYPLPNYQLQVYSDIEPIQNGSGDPSPDNIRPIVPRSSVTVHSTGKNLFHAGDVTVKDSVVSIDFNPPLQPGTYTVSALVNSDSETATGAMITVPYDNGEPGMVMSFGFGDSRNANMITLAHSVSKIDFYNNIGVNEAGVTTNWMDVQIEIGSKMTEYEPYTSYALKAVEFNTPVYAGCIHLNTGDLLTGRFNYREVDGNWTESFFLNNNPGKPDTSYYVYNLTENECIAIDNCAIMSHYRNHPTLSFNDDNGVYNVFRYYNHNGLTRLAIRPDLSKYPTAADFKAYLMAQKEAGTPVQFAYETVKPDIKESNIAEGQVIIASSGVNVLRSDSGETTVKGRLAPAYQDSVQNERISAVEEAVVNGGGSGGSSGASGEDGGFYVPSVSGSGVLSWEATKEDMPSVASANIKGPQGEKGADGKTPVKGTDYFTAADIADMVSQVKSSLGYTSETWTFKMADGSTITKKVALT